MHVVGLDLLGPNYLRSVLSLRPSYLAGTCLRKRPDSFRIWGLIAFSFSFVFLFGSSTAKAQVQTLYEANFDADSGTSGTALSGASPDAWSATETGGGTMSISEWTSPVGDSRFEYRSGRI